MSASGQDLTPQQVGALKRAVLSGAVSPGLFGGDKYATGEGIMDAQLAVEGLPDEAADVTAIVGGAAFGGALLYAARRLQDR
jgi:hypothetical protein